MQTDINAPFNYGWAEVVNVTTKSIGIRRGKDKVTWIPRKAVHESCTLMTTASDGKPVMQGSLIVAMWFAARLGWPGKPHLPVLSPEEKAKRGMQPKPPKAPRPPKQKKPAPMTLPGL